MESIDLGGNDVLSMDLAKSLVSCSTFKAEEAISKMRAKFIYNGCQQVEAPYFSQEGVRCELLRANGEGWRKGKVRFRLEFVPDDEPVPKSTDAVLGGSE